jgi:serine/threonine protein kinase
MISGETPFYKSGMEQMDLFRAIVKGDFEMPDGVSKDAASLISGLLNKEPTQRLGSLRGGEDDILNHPFFKSIDLTKLRRKEIKAPFVPKVKDPLDSSNFEDWGHLEDKTKHKYPKIAAKDEKIFEEF